MEAEPTRPAPVGPSAAGVKFAPGEVIVRRYWRGGRLSFVVPLRVAGDDVHGLRLWLPIGSPYWRLEDGDGRSLHDAPIHELDEPRLVSHRWTGSDVMIWMPDAATYSIWWLWTDGAFDGWYVNLEEPYARWADRGCAGVDTGDHGLDVVIDRDRRWRWKDEAEFDARIGRPSYWSPAEANQIRGTGQRLIAAAEAGSFPFDGTWTGFRPDASWTMPALPHGYDRPRAAVSRAG